MPTRDRISQIPPSYRRLRPLIGVEKSADVRLTVDLVAGALSEAKLRGILVIRVNSKNAEVAYSLDLESRAVTEGVEPEASLDVSLGEITWRQVLSGGLSPWRALATRRLLLSGDFTLAHELVAALAHK